ncbi:MAG TPA: DUF58 domain-containing protein [Nitrososphaerales archaeon]|nr:DUF58 domain-containing protein [Nitrososphaerales archaeon]
MTLTTRGQRFLAAAALLLSLGLVFVDTFIQAASIAAMAFIVYDMFDARRTSHKGQSSVKLSPETFRATLAIGDSASFKTNLTADRRVVLDTSEASWISVEPPNFEPGNWPVLLTGSPLFSGHYSTSNIGALVTSRYGLFSTMARPELFLTLRVYPRFLLTALAVAEALAKTGTGIGGENETELIGTGLEYAETRHYQPGDSLRRIDWKATARFSSLMVKQFYREIGGAVNLVYLLEAPGPRTHDELATEFLNVVISATRRGTPVKVTVYNKEEMVVKFSGKGHEALSSALSLVLEKSGISLDEIYSLLDVLPISQERRALILSGKDNLAGLLGRTKTVGSALNRKPNEMMEELFSTEPSPSFVVLSSLVSRNQLLPEMIEELRTRGCAVVLAYPHKPWEDASNLEEAYRMSLSQEKLLKFAASKGCTLASLPLQASRLPTQLPIPAHLITSAG